MEEQSYLQWLAGQTPTTWWHDSADPDELREGLANAASGVTTNPVLAYQAVKSNPRHWASALEAAPAELTDEGRAEMLLKHVVQGAARMLEPEHERSSGAAGYVCSQVNPAKPADREAMLAMARRFHSWAPNIAVKLPVTAAGLDVLEECAAEGITATGTVSFTVPQVIAVAERYRRGLARARQAGKAPGRCFAVVMIGRLDDYLRDLAMDCGADVSESDIKRSGLAVVKRAYSIFKERGYEAVLIIAALRGSHHLAGLAGAELIMSVHPKVQAMLRQPDVPREAGIGVPVDRQAIRRLEALPEFVRAYEPDGMSPEEFASFGLTQRTLTQFTEAGWAMLESFTRVASYG